MRATVTDIAREASVSVATVDRVLNNRAGVRERTRARVYESARRLGYIETNAAHARENAAPLRLDFALPAGDDPFFAALADEIEALARARPGLSAAVARLDNSRPEALAAGLMAYNGRTQGLGVVAPDHPAIREAIRTLIANGVAVTTMVSDVPFVPRAAFVGVDNRAAGRLAGYILRRFLGAERPAQVAMFAGSLSYRAHEEREMGFRRLLAEEAPHLRIVELREMRDDPARAYREACALLDAYPELAGIYNIGGGNAGIARALKERGRRPVFVAHEVSADTRPLLLDGTLDAAIDQNPRAQARAALDALESAARGATPTPQPIRCEVIFRENLPDA